jgi:diguanylate cyclase (GGDEF)-like protein
VRDLVEQHELVRRQDRVMRRVRVAAALLALLQLAVYQPPGELEVPWPQLLLGAAVAGVLMAISGLSWLTGRSRSPQTLRRSGLVQLVADSAVCLAVIWAFGFDPGSMVWSLMLLPVLEGALRFRLRGAVLTWLALGIGYVGGELWAAQAYEVVAHRPSDVSYAVGLVGVVALAFGSVVGHLEERNEQYRQARERLASLVYIDALTRLPNRARLLGTLDRFDGQDVGYGVAFLDLDRFKEVNDAHGHETGDEVLRGVAHRLEEAARPPDLVARLAGDEFVVVLPGLRDPDAAVRVAERLTAAARASVATPDGPLPVEASVGLALGHGRAAAGQEVLRHADAAMYAAKAVASARPVVVDVTGGEVVELQGPVPDESASALTPRVRDEQ